MSTNNNGRMKLAKLLNSDYVASFNNGSTEYDSNCRPSNASSSGSSTPLWNQQLSPYVNSPWIAFHGGTAHGVHSNELIGSFVREAGHIYSLATCGDLLYTGSESKNVRVWKNMKEFSGFKSTSGLVKSIVISNGVVFTGHQDGKIRLWQASSKDPSSYVRVGTLPSLKDSIIKSLNPKNYVEVRRRRKVLGIKHFDAVSCLCLNHGDDDDNDNEEALLLYSGSWDKTVKVWRVSDSKCIESINAHDDAVNAVAVSRYDGLVLTGSADGVVKVWKKEILNGGSSRQIRVVTTKHHMIRVLLEQESAITSLAIDKSARTVYCGSSNGLVNFWKRDRRGEFVHGGVLRGHKLAVLCLTEKGNLVISGSADKTICVWRREYESGVHTCLTILTGHTGPVKCLAMVKDNSYYRKGDDDDHAWIIYSGSLDKSVNVWRVSEQMSDYHYR